MIATIFTCFKTIFCLLILTIVSGSYYDDDIVVDITDVRIYRNSSSVLLSIAGGNLINIRVTGQNLLDKK